MVHFNTTSDTRVDFTQTIIDKFSETEIETLIRYCASNSRWKVGKIENIIFAELLNKQKVGPKTDWSEFGFTRTSLYFKHFPYNQIESKDKVTIVTKKEKNIRLNIEKPYPGVNGYGSQVIIEGKGLYIEIFERSSKIERVLTEKAYRQICNELSFVYHNLLQIKEDGVYSGDSLYQPVLPKKAFLTVKDGIQPGVYEILGSINPVSSGILFIKVVSLKDNKSLSNYDVYNDSLRIAPWSKTGDKYYWYYTEVIISEGNWDIKYPVMFELWHKSSNKDVKLIETSYFINGWEQ